MKIKKIKINNYGKLENKEINLENRINIIYGKNESGKSTLLNYIKNIFYGISKNKNGKDISDFEKYKPWGKEDYSGRLSYELDNGEKFEIYRDFTKKNPKLFNEQLEDVSKDFNIVKKDGIQFFYDQTGVDETMFTSTVVSMQEEVKLDRQDQNVLVQKLANLAGTGEDSLSYQKVMERLNKRQVEEIGTDRSQGRPINIVRDRMKKIEFVLKDLHEYQKDKMINEDKKAAYIEKISILEQELQLYKQINIILLCKQNEEDKANADKEAKDFEQPDNIVSAKICKNSGKKATDKCKNTYTEIFVKGTVPEDCTGHTTVKICKETNKVATEFCPDTEEKVYAQEIDKEKAGNWKTDGGESKNTPPTDVCDVHTEAPEIDVPVVVGKTKEKEKSS